MPNTRFNKNEVIPNNCYVNITVENVSRPDGWSSHQIANVRPQLDEIPQGILNGMMSNDQSESVSNAINNAINHVSDRQQFRQNLDNHQHPAQQSRSANNSPIIQPQQQQQQLSQRRVPQLPQIIPVLSVSQLPINNKKPVNPDEKIEENDILPMLEHDRIDILFPKLVFRLQQYFVKNYYEMAIHFMNFDHRQIIAALNDELILQELSQKINDELDNYNKKPLAIRMETSIWNDKTINTNIDELIMMKKEKLLKELNIFSQPFQKTSHLLKCITNNIRKINCLRVNQMMHLIKENSRKTLIDMCSNAQTLIQTILITQNVIHKHVTDNCIQIANQLKQKELSKDSDSQNNQNNNENNNNNEYKEENKDDNTENKEDTNINDSQSVNEDAQLPSQIPIEISMNRPLANSCTQYLKVYPVAQTVPEIVILVLFIGISLVLIFFCML